jgi:hypothetical protein
MTAKNLTAHEIRAAAASVAGARGMGIATTASEAAPALLERAEVVLSTMLARAAGMEPSAPDQADERRYYAYAAMAAAYMAAIDELRAALGLETHAAIAAAAREVRNQAARDAAEIRATQEVAAQAKIAATEQAARTAACDAMTTLFVDGRGQRVAIADKTSYSEGRFSSLGGWNEGGDVIGRRMSMTAEDGRDVTGEVVVMPDGEFRLEQPYSRSYPNGGKSWHGGKLVTVDTTATSEWLPEGAVVPEWRSESRVACDWEAAYQARADEVMLADLEAMPEAWLQGRARLVEAFSADYSATYGGQNGRKYSVRTELRADLDEYQAVQRAADAEKSARMASSPFAALAALRRAA